MAITRPVTKTLISTTAWGIPITDQVNTNTTDIAALKPTAWISATLMNGWTNYGGGFTPVSYCKIGTIVYIRGLMSGGTMPSVAFVLPVGYRPAYNYQFPAVAFGAYAWFEVGSTGNVTPNQGATTAFNVNCSVSTT